MLDALFPYQTIGATWLSKRPQALLADDMGLGKSAQAVRACDLVGAERILVLCPASVRINWSREFFRFSPMDRACAVIFTGKDTIPATGVVICSYDLLQAHGAAFKAIQWDVLILDEAHALKERSAKRTKAVYGHGKRSPGIIASCAHVWRLSGTPAPNDASELWTHLKSAGVVTEPFWGFTFRYCSGFDSTFGYKITGHKNTEELKALMAPVLLRRKKDEVLRELPPLRFAEVTVERSAAFLDDATFGELDAAEAYRDFKVGNQSLQDALNAIRPSDHAEDDRLALLEAAGPALATLRRYIGLAKLPSICDLLEEELATGQLDKIVLFAMHRAVVERTVATLSAFGAVAVYGGTNQAQRQANIDRFQSEPKCRVFVGNILAAGTGLTLTAAHEVAFLEQSWVPSDNAQAAMRCHRIGQLNPVRVRIFSLAGTVDEQVQATLLRKARELTKIF